MSRSRIRQLLVALAAVTAAACDSGNTPVVPTPPDPAPTITETFSGTVGQNGAVTFNFTTKAAGQVTARLALQTPDETIPMGFSLGEWNGLACEVKIRNDNALVGAIIAGNVSGAGTLCASYYDVGRIPDPNPNPVRLTFEIVLVHP